jgi:hypothetical protein
MAFTSDRFCVSLRKNSDDADIRKFIESQKSLSSSIRLLIKAYMATAKKLDVESEDLFDIIDSVSVGNLQSLSSELIDSERSVMPFNHGKRSVVDSEPVVANVQSDAEPKIEDQIEKKSETEVISETVTNEKQNDPKTSPGDQKTSVSDFMGDFG